MAVFMAEIEPLSLEYYAGVLSFHCEVLSYIVMKSLVLWG
jgi:hypothetical protein